MAPIEEKITQHQLRPVRSEVLKRVDKVKRGRGRLKLTWNESVKRDIKD